MMRSASSSKALNSLSLVLIALPRTLQRNPFPRGDYAFLAGRLVGVWLIIALLFYSVRWYLQLNGHTYKLARQAWAWILLVYSLIDLIAVIFTRLQGILGIAIMLLWILVAVTCWKDGVLDSVEG
jgi:hypothetical protein